VSLPPPAPPPTAVTTLSETDRRRWRDDGWLKVDALVPAADVAPARRALEKLRPRPRRRGGQFDGIVEFPFDAVELSLLALHPGVVAVAEALLETADVRLYHAEAWSKYAGAADYDQELHRDFLNHTETVPSADPRFGQVPCFLYLSDVGPGDGPTHFVDLPRTAGLPLLPHHLRRHEHGDVYAAEVAATGPAGTLVAYRPETFHRGTALAAGATRFTLLVSFRPAAAEWMQRYGWADRGFWPGWVPFVEAATPRQLELVGFPPPGHPFWTPETRAGTALRYPGLDLTPWR